MLTAGTLKNLHMRFCPLTKYTCSTPFYWDTSKQAYVPLQSYQLIQWLATFVFCHLFLLVYFIYLLIFLIANDIPEEEDITQNPFNTEKLTIYLGIGEWGMAAQILFICSLCVQHQQRFASSFTMIFELDAKYTTDYQLQNVRHPKALLLEKLVQVSTSVSLLVPFVMLPIFFHPAYPIRNMFQSILEQKLSPGSPLAWIMCGIEMLAVVYYCGMAVTLALYCIIMDVTSEIWLEMFSPVAIQPHVYLGGKQYFQTERLGRMCEEELVTKYRSIQIFANVGNEWMATVRGASHLMGIVMVGVMAAVCLIRYAGVLVADGSLSAIMLLIGVVIVLVFTVFFCYVECSRMDSLEVLWKTYKRRMMNGSKRNGSAFKAARSMSEINLKGAYPFCNVNNSTFLELMEVGVNRLVDILLVLH